MSSRTISNLNFSGKANIGEEIDLTTEDYTNDVPFSVYVGTAGGLKVDLLPGATVTFGNAVAGYHPILCTKVYKEGTDADNLIAFWSI